MNNGFNPVKQEKDGVRASRVIWSTESINIALRALEQGRKLVANPFYENDPKLLKGDLVFQRTQEEISEWRKCKNDIIYWSNTYAKLMTPEGIKNVILRDYQERYLRHVSKSQLSIYLSCRQSGKCLIFNELVKIRIGEKSNIPSNILKYWKKRYYHSKEDYYEIPLFELYNAFDNSEIWKIKYRIYKRIQELQKYNSNAKIQLISNLFDVLNKLNESCSYKILKSFMLEDIYVKSEEGWSLVGYIHQTKPFEVYTLNTKNGLTLHCADHHLIYNANMKAVPVIDLHSGDQIMTEFGVDEVVDVIKDHHEINMCDLTCFNTNESYYSNGILSHNTTTSALYLLHYVCFNVDKNTLVLGNKRRTAVEILDKIKKIYLELPFFLKPGIYKWNESEIVLDNGCRIMAEATTINSGISYTFHCVLADEFAHVPPNILDKFYNNLFPTITAGKAKFIITSTQNGYNLFYRLYKAAEAGENDYKSFKTDWWEVPEWNPETRSWEKRDESWHQRQVANYGSEEAFNRQFGTNFDISANTMISLPVLNQRKQTLYEFINKDLPGVSEVENWYWHPEYDPRSMLKKDYLIITCDLAEGKGGDSTVFMIYRMVDSGQNYSNDRTECVGFYKSNKSDRDQYVLSLLRLMNLYCDPEQVLLSYEKNTYGDLFLNTIMNKIDQDNIGLYKNVDYSCIVKFNDSNKFIDRYGIKITSGNKSQYCLLFKEDYEKDIIRNESSQFMTELENFTDDGSGHYRASFGHDDLVMASIQLEFVKKTLQYKVMRNNFNERLITGLKNDQFYNPYDFEEYNDINYGKRLQ